jgi:hypothetical protein
MKKTRKEWQAQGQDVARPIQIDYYWDARMNGNPARKGFAETDFNARGNAYRKVGQQYFNKAVIHNRITGTELCVLRRDPRTNGIDVKDSTFENVIRERHG